MGDAEKAFPLTKKRAAGRELSRDNPGLDDEDSSDQETGTFKRATDEVIASRRIVKVRRNQTSSNPSPNPFAAIRLVPATESGVVIAGATAEKVGANDKTVLKDQKDYVKEETEKTLSEDAGKDAVKEDAGKDDVKEEAEKTLPEDAGKDAGKESEKDGEENIKKSESNSGGEPVTEAAADKDNTEDKKTETVSEATKPEVDEGKTAGGDTNDKEDRNDDGDKNVDQGTQGAALSSFQQLSSSQNAFTGLVGTGFSTSTFSFGSNPKEGSGFSASSGSLFGQTNDQPAFSFGLSNNGNSSFFNTPGASIIHKSEGTGFPSMQEVAVETGEENERVVFSADSVLFEFTDKSWKERGKGELKVNASTTGTERARLVMRARGNYRLILNASLYPDMKLANMEKRGITFACINSNGEGKDGLSTFALKFKDASVVEEFRTVVIAHKDKTPAVLKTPENSPEASDE
ncbi:nuclear pore complex protein NUP50B [Tripterygium wilfordii]|uniref:Nuclear pore complex protein NUP50B n=1 Tax=Tripterygium wilfordii TaxID=458696 RepID=A0A7J7D5R5_TRIWF|nr:nuclear pore complex protein NUP50A-like [Tripterygium wilfordii]XP_038713920.1 nuclear pore complex protein NUP50A-like [Tripterygium wilfordii]KAF5741697.1 nuclear pore complex protein NUP50B [Tripterygium wilfordii]